MVISRLQAAIRFYINGTALPRYLSVDDFSAMSEEEFRAWCLGDDRAREQVRGRFATAA